MTDLTRPRQREISVDQRLAPRTADARPAAELDGVPHLLSLAVPA